MKRPAQNGQTTTSWMNVNMRSGPLSLKIEHTHTAQKSLNSSRNDVPHKILWANNKCGLFLAAGVIWCGFDLSNVEQAAIVAQLSEHEICSSIYYQLVYYISGATEPKKKSSIGIEKHIFGDKLSAFIRHSFFFCLWMEGFNANAMIMTEIYARKSSNLFSRHNTLRNSRRLANVSNVNQCTIRMPIFSLACETGCKAQRVSIRLIRPIYDVYNGVILLVRGKERKFRFIASEALKWKLKLYGPQRREDNSKRIHCLSATQSTTYSDEIKRCA